METGGKYKNNLSKMHKLIQNVATTKYILINIFYYRQHQKKLVKNSIRGEDVVHNNGMTIKQENRFNHHHLGFSRPPIDTDFPLEMRN